MYSKSRNSKCDLLTRKKKNVKNSTYSSNLALDIETSAMNKEQDIGSSRCVIMTGKIPIQKPIQYALVLIVSVSNKHIFGS